MSNESPGQRILKQWRRLSPIPGGRRIFSWAVGRGAPYTGTIGARIVDLRPGYARAELRDRRAVRNHLRSVHAVALVNLGEVTSGLAMLTGLPPSVRGIVSGISVDYVKKARGRLTAECHCEVPERVDSKQEHLVVAVIRDTEGDEVSRVSVRWLLAPKAAREEHAAA